LAVQRGHDQGALDGIQVAGTGVDAAAIRAAVDLFYERVLADPALAGIFQGVDMDRLKMHQRAFVLRALGGSSLYSGREMQTAHLDIHVTDEQFTDALVHLIASLREVGVGDDVIDRARGDIQGLRALIVER
jgi:hemoglobin